MINSDFDLVGKTIKEFEITKNYCGSIESVLIVFSNGAKLNLEAFECGSGAEVGISLDFSDVKKELTTEELDFIYKSIVAE